jgi:hypothetical protein
MLVNREPLTPAFVQDYLRRIVDIEISLDEATEILPRIEENRASLALLDRFDIKEVRPASTYNPVSPTILNGGG